MLPDTLGRWKEACAMFGKGLIFVTLLCFAVFFFCSCTKVESSFDLDSSLQTFESVEDESANKILSQIVESAENRETDDAFMPFVKTAAAEYAYIEIVPGGLDAYREDGSVVESARLSDEDAERVFELLRQIRIEKPPLNKNTWAGSPDGGYRAIFLVSRYISSMTDDVNTLSVIPGGKVVTISSIQFLADEEVVSELCSLYDELYRKYYPELAAKWDAIANGS